MVPVIKKHRNTEEVVWIELDEILGWGTEGYRITCMTVEETFYWPTSLEDLEKIPKYERTDRSFVARLDKVIRYNKELRTFHFGEDHVPYVTISRKHIQRLKDFIAKLESK